MKSTGEAINFIKDLKDLFYAPVIRFSLLLAVLLLAAPALAQSDVLLVFGELKDMDSGKGMIGAAVIATDTLTPAFVQVAKVKRNGKFTVHLPMERVYRVVFEAPGHAAKNVVIDTRGIPSAYRKDGFRMQLKIQLPVIYPSMDYSLMQRPIGVARYDAGQTEIVWDPAGMEEDRKLYEDFMERYEAAKKASEGR